MRDALFHFVTSLSGGYVLVKAGKVECSIKSLVLLSVLSLLVDVDHFLQYVNVSTEILHNVFIILALLFIYALLGSSERLNRYKQYFLILTVMLCGHLTADMIEGVFGIPLFYPFSEKLYQIPDNWEIDLFQETDKPVIGKAGIALAAYYAIIALTTLYLRVVSRARTARKQNTSR